MSTGRMVLRGVLVCMVLGLGWLGYALWAKGQPSYYWNRAQRALASDDLAAAKIHLQNLLKRHPEHSDGHKAMADVLVREAAPEGTEVSVAAVPQALEHLAESLRLTPTDLETQKRLLGAYLYLRQLGKAAEIAERVVKAEPENADALFPLAWRAVERKQLRTAEELFERLARTQSRRVFETLALQLKMYEDAGDKEKVAAVLANVARLANELGSEQFSLLTRRDREVLLDLSLAHVLRAEDVRTGHLRLETLLTAAEKLSQGRLLVGKPAETASYALVALNVKYPQATLNPELRAQRDELTARTATLTGEGIAQGEAAPINHLVAAEAAFARHDHEEGLATLAKGLEAAQGEQHAKAALDLHMAAARRLVMLKRYGEAEQHVAALLTDSDAAGWGHLLSGSIAANEGRFDKAMNHFQQARQKLGNTLVVRMALASTHLALKQWKEAAPLLASLHVKFDDLDDEQRLWAEQHLGSGARVHFDELRCRLALDQWNEAQANLEALKGSELEPQGWALAVGYLFSKQQLAQATSLLAASRQKFPDQMNLAVMEAQLLAGKGDRAGASAVIEQFAAAQPEDVSRQLLLIRWRMQHGEFSMALAKIESVEKLELPAPQRQFVKAMKAQTLLALNRPTEALDLIAELRADPQTMAAGNVLEAVAQLRKQNVDAAETALAAATAAQPRSGVLGIIHGRVAEMQGNYGDAVDALAPALDVTGLEAHAHAAMLSSLMKLVETQGLAAGEQKVLELLEKHPGDHVLLAVRADLYFRQGQFEQGMKILDDAERHRPTQAAIPLLKSRAWALRGNWTNVLGEARRSLRLAPEHPGALVMAAQGAFGLKRYTDAIDYSRQARQRHADLRDAYLIEAAGLSQLARYEDAVRTLSAYLLKNPHDPVATTTLSATWEAAGDGEQALLVLREIRRAQPDDVRWPLTEIGLLLRLKRVDEAQQIADEVLTDERGAAVMVAAAETFAAHNELELAEAWGRRALALAKPEEQALPRLLLGRLCLRKHSLRPDPALLAEARDHFAAVVAEHPQHLVAANNLAWLLATEFNQAEEAVRVVEVVRAGRDAALFPAEFVDTLAEAYRRAGRSSEAETLLTPLVASRPEDANLLFQFGMVLHERGKDAAARNALTKAARLGLDPQRTVDAQRVLAALDPGQAAAP